MSGRSSNASSARQMRRIAAGLFAAVLAPLAAAAQCAMCRTTLLSSPEARMLIGGLRQGTVLLLIVPAAIVALAVRRLRRSGLLAGAPPQRAEAEASPSNVGTIY